ncbi:hypothetical protein LINPERHAP1_LOCUS43386 [Linum perenne]
MLAIHRYPVSFRNFRRGAVFSHPRNVSSARMYPSSCRSIHVQETPSDIPRVLKPTISVDGGTQPAAIPPPSDSESPPISPGSAAPPHPNYLTNNFNWQWRRGKRRQEWIK